MLLNATEHLKHFELFSLVCAISAATKTSDFSLRCRPWPSATVAIWVGLWMRWRRQNQTANLPCIRTAWSAAGRCDRGCYQCFVLGHAGGTWTWNYESLKPWNRQQFVACGQVSHAAFHRPRVRDNSKLRWRLPWLVLELVVRLWHWSLFSSCIGRRQLAVSF